jgi:hypothetical protein
MVAENYVLPDQKTLFHLFHKKAPGNQVWTTNSISEPGSQESYRNIF